jgi:hypothetical protein
VEDVIALVRLRGAEVFVPLVVVDVVHDDVVEPVRVARDAEHRRVEADVELVQSLPRPRAWLEEPSVGAVVHREDEPLHEDGVEDGEVARAEDVRGVVEEQHGGGPHRDRDVEEEHGDLHVSFVVEVPFQPGGDEGGRGEDRLVARGGQVVEVDLLAHASWIDRGGETWGTRRSATGRGGGKRKAARVS